jgi:hypothetical protein
MDQNQAATILIQAATLAQSKGTFTLKEAAAVSEAVDTLTAPPQKQEVQESQETEEDND